MITQPSRLRRIALIAAALIAITAAAVALLTSESAGTGATAASTIGPVSVMPDGDGARCAPTAGSPGGGNNYIPDAPEQQSLGEGFVVQGTMRAAGDCRPLADVAVQVWLADDSGGETENRATVRTDDQGRYRIETGRPAPQFGEPHVHAAYDRGTYADVFVRRVVDEDASETVIDMVLEREVA